MPDLIIKHPERATDTFPLGRLRITIGRSARNDVCIPDPFASRVHAEVRREGDGYVLQDLGSANGTLYNGERLRAPVMLTPGGRVQIGETEIEYAEPAVNATFSSIADELPSAAPEATISLNSEQRSTSGLLEAIEEARTQKSGELPRSSHADSGAVSGQRTAVTPGRVATAAVTVPAPARVVPTANARGGDEHGDLLALISKVSVTLLAPATLDEILRQIVALVFEAVPADRCLIMLRDGASGDELKVRVAQLRDQRQGSGVGEIRVSRSIIEEVVAQGRSVLTSDAQHDPRFMSNTMTIQGIRSVLAVPLGVGAKIFGIIYADSPLGEAKFTQDHLTVLTTLASVAAIRVENARLVEEQLDRERLERELGLAREIQERFQPASSPQVPGYELQGISFPCYEIGGDYYDFIERHDGRMVVALGDVSGKGTSAALLMSSLHAAIHAQVATHKSIVETIGAVNRYLAETIPSNRFITLFYAELDPLTGGLAFLNAGHNPPIIIHAAGTMEQLGAGGMPLGISPDAPYREGRTQLQPGDVLVAYSDGVTETQNQAGEEFGPLRLNDVIARNLNASAAGIRDKIEAALTKFAQGTASVDDITLVIVKRQE